MTWKEYWQMTKWEWFCEGFRIIPYIIDCYTTQYLMEMMTSGKHYRGDGVVNTSILMMILTIIVCHLNAS